VTLPTPADAEERVTDIQHELLQLWPSNHVSSLVLGNFRVIDLSRPKDELKLGGSHNHGRKSTTTRPTVMAGDLLTLYTEVLYAT